MTAVSAAHTERLWTIEEWVDMPRPITGERFELVRGQLVQTPEDGTIRHGNAGDNLRDMLKSALPQDTWKVLTRGGLRLVEGPRPTLRLPDVWVLTRAAFDQYNEFSSVPASEVLLVVEVVSPATTKTDRVDKLAEYAAAGIPHYWIFDVRSRRRGPKPTVLKLV